MFWEAGSRFGVARTVDAALWENSDFFHEPKQRYEELLEVGDSLLPLMADSEINSWRFLVMPGWFHLWLLLAYPGHQILRPSP